MKHFNKTFKLTNFFLHIELVDIYKNKSDDKLYTYPLLNIDFAVKEKGSSVVRSLVISTLYLTIMIGKKGKV